MSNNGLGRLGAAPVRAVIFDLWDTLVLWPSEAFEDVKRALSAHIADFDEGWDTTYQHRQRGSIEDQTRDLLPEIVLHLSAVFGREDGVVGFHRSNEACSPNDAADASDGGPYRPRALEPT